MRFLAENGLILAEYWPFEVWYGIGAWGGSGTDWGESEI